jgi:hydrogenase/urease accessory protein HupE
MTKRLFEPVELARIRRDAICVIIRLGLGGYQLQGPAENILVPESYVAWATVVNELGNEGYRLVTVEEYAAASATGVAEVLAQLHSQGSLFALVHESFLVVPLPEKEAVLPEIEI